MGAETMTSTASDLFQALRSRFYARKVVRDLLWAITSPHLIDATRFPVLPVAFGLDDRDATTTELASWLDALDADPSSLITFLRGCVTSDITSPTRPKALALGVYFASLIEFWIQCCPLLHIVQFQRGKQIISTSNQTLGQLKFLFRVIRDRNDTDAFNDFHVECSVKFFLLHPLDEQFQSLTDGFQSQDDVEQAAYPLEQFVGPHLGENLAWRVQEVARKLDMCRGESVQRWLQDHYSDRVVSRMVLKGYLFYPLHHFNSTSEVSRGHDWLFHRNPTSQDRCEESQRRHNPSIGVDHLRGWWASDLDQEFATRVCANDMARFGESRFVVLPKLHWLTPLVAEADTDGRVIVQGEDELHIETVESMTLDEILTHARSHFATLANSPEAEAKGGVVMPLLVAEIVCCQPNDVEYDQSVQRWKELSRGFLLDPKSWDPRPLCHAAVRFKRTNDDDNAREREYEGRREWITDGVIKPTEQEAELARQRKLHAFADVDTVTPQSMCQELLEILAREQKTYTHANLKQSVQSVLVHITNKKDSSGKPQFLLKSLEFLVFAHHDDEDTNTDKTNDAKLVQRVAHLILDAFEGQPASRGDEANLLSEYVAFFDVVARDESRWDYLNLTLRALDMLCTSPKSSTQLVTNGIFSTPLRRLLDKKIPRWNAVAVEIVRLVYADSQREAVTALRHEMLEKLTAQHDWKHAEQLAIIACRADVTLLVTLYKRFSALNMPKPMKRLRKALSRVHTSKDFHELHEIRHSGQAFGLLHALGPAVDTEANRKCILGQIPPLQWTLVDTPEHIDDILAKLSTVVETRQAQPTFVGLDCEWRPQFFVKDADQSEGNEEFSMEEHEGVSLYQIAVEDHVYVVDVHVLGVVAAAPLDFIWNTRRGTFILIGFCVAGDLQRLHHSFPSLLSQTTSSQKLLIELKQMALYRQLPAGPWGLSQLYEACFNEPIDKEEQCSDWGLRPLSDQQLEYAARDAYAVRNVALHLLADIASQEDDLTSYVERFAVVTTFANSVADASLGHWLMTLAPLNETHVRAALVALDLSTIAGSLFLVDKETWKDQARLPEGLVVKTIAVVLRRNGKTPIGTSVRYAAVVLSVDLSIDMVALATHFNVNEVDLQLADSETLLRVFGYPRGSIGPIGLREQQAVHVVLDEALLTETAILPGAGQADLTYAIAPNVLIKTVGATVTRISSDSTA